MMNKTMGTSQREREREGAACAIPAIIMAVGLFE